ncbi:GNAT family N-acetyltransferase [Halopseudomonas aestusnigri]|nr:GNAT family N-acetyltransferase [Halopseudomonas aestusnigri]OWL91409.1 hypothetical protein B7O88_03735 [Halopseudomonas aestusnigri]
MPDPSAASAPSAATAFMRLSDEQRPLANKFYRQYHSGMKARGHHQVWVARTHELQACLCLQTVDQCWWLTGLLVAPAQRSQGLASSLLEHVRQQHRGDIWLFCAPNLVPFYRANGYEPGEDAPISLRDKLLRYQRSKALLAMVNRTQATLPR